MEIHWSGVTRYHDWMKDEAAFPAAMIRRFAEEGLTGNLDWVQTGIHNPKETLVAGSKSIIDYLGFTPKKNDLYSIAGGGEEPFKWKLTLGLFPFDKETAMVKGYNIINLWFEKNELLNVNGSDCLFSLFRNLHAGDNTEFAFIHPYDRWSELTDAFRGPYKKPVTFNPLFTGVYWATFLGKGQLELFDQQKISAIQSQRLDRRGTDACYIRMTENIADALNPETETEMIALTEQFRAALK